MKRLLLYALILSAVLVLPTDAVDVAELRPVQTIAVYRDHNAWVIKTDTEDIGMGYSVEAAFENLMKTTPAMIYLDTADYLILHADAFDAIDVLRARLKDSVALFQYRGNPELDKVSKYLAVHGEKIRLKQWKQGTNLPILDCTGDRFFFT